ncbi:UNVERIFIED_CONTAM: hypothetical protein FKN15_014344 [Acipenser sinensis]
MKNLRRKLNRQTAKKTEKRAGKCGGARNASKTSEKRTNEPQEESANEQQEETDGKLGAALSAKRRYQHCDQWESWGDQKKWSDLPKTLPYRHNGAPSYLPEIWAKHTKRHT